jgi:Tfp pilus assembly protein PilN
MKLQINFAREPFRNRRLFWLLLASVIAIASLVGLNALQSQAGLEQQIALLEPKVLQMEKRTKEGQPIDFSDSTLTLGQNQALIVAQDLITRKSFSWSQLLNDLERFIPSDVRVTRIGVDNVGRSKEAEGKSVSLSFDVVGKSSTAVTQMISELNRSARFAVYPKSQRQVEGTEEVEFQLGVEYRPAQFGATPSVGAKTQIASQIGGAQQ